MGELATAADPGDVLVSIGLGSCIGLALVDAGARIAGLAHIMLPGPGESSTRPPGTFADTGVPALLHAVIVAGGRRNRLNAVIVGGAQMFGAAGRIQVGSRNEESVRAALREVRLPIVGAETGGGSGRTIRVYMDDVRVTSRAAGGSELVLYGGSGVAVAA